MKAVLKIFILLVSITISGAGHNDDIMNYRRRRQTTGGNDVAIECVPYHVSIELEGRRFCSGSIITRNWIITVAHCMDRSKEYYKIRTGSSFTTIGGFLHTIHTVVKHPNYTINQINHAYNDVALIKVNEPFKFNKFSQAIELLNFNEITPVGSIGFTSGFHQLTSHDKIERLQIIKSKVISKQECYALYQNNFYISKNQFCAHSSENGEGLCAGDSGSPFVINNLLYGMVSWGLGCGLPQFPDIFTKIAPHRHWIDGIVKLSYSPIKYPGDYELYRKSMNIYKYNIMNGIKFINYHG